MNVYIFAAEYTKNTGQAISWKAGRVGVVTMTEKILIFEDDD